LAEEKAETTREALAAQEVPVVAVPVLADRSNTFPMVALALLDKEVTVEEATKLGTTLAVVVEAAQAAQVLQESTLLAAEAVTA
jgi:hypothetical protein